MIKSKRYPCTDDFCKDNDCVCKYKEQPLYEDSGCYVLEVGRYMMKIIVISMQRPFLGYNCIDEFCKGNGCVCKYIDESLYEDIECNDHTEGRCMTIEQYDKYMTEPKLYSCTDEFYKGNDCECKYKEQPLCEDIGRETRGR